MKRSAIFDEYRKYRYSLTRDWNEKGPKVVFIMLNPSLANDKEDDRTTKRIINFAKKFGYGSLDVVNLFAYITPKYKELKDLEKSEAIGRENYKYLIRALNSADKIIAAWGENCTIHQRDIEIDQLLDGYDIDSLGPLTRDGYPRHPLYLSNDVEHLPYKRSIKRVPKLDRTVPAIEHQGQDFEVLMRRYKDFLIQEYHLSESSAKDYVGRYKGIINRGTYNGDSLMTPTLKAAIEKEFPNSKKHYVLNLERYIEFQKKQS